VPSGSTSYNYVDALTKPAFSAVAVTGGNAPRPSGTSWTMPSSVTAKAAPASGRLLCGTVQVRTDANMLIDSGDEVVRSVG
jgi:hypothetical protein